MLERERRQTMIGIAASAVLFAVLFLITFRTRADSQERQPVDIVIFGDSVIGEIRDERSIPMLLEKNLGKSIYNGAFSGTGAARTDQERRLDYTRDMYSLAELSRSVNSGDFGVQQSIFMRESNTEFFESVVDGLDRIDFKKVDVILIQQGINDYHAGVPIEDQAAPYDDRTFLGALRTAVRCFRKVNPQVRIVLLTPTYAWYLESGLTCEEADYGGGVLEDYVNAQRRLAQELDIEMIDLYHDFYPHEGQEDWRIYTREGLHPNDDGRRKIAETIAEYLRQSDEKK